MSGADGHPDDGRGALARTVVAAVPDPEVPALTIEELGILRDVTVDERGRAEVTITPTYSGCPAMGDIEQEIRRRLTEAGFDDVAVRTVYSPPWTTDMLDDTARRKLLAAGIAPPRGPADLDAPILCPRCSAADTQVVSEFGSTACKALMVCERCGEPFHRFKEHR